ncbi:leucine-rich repeat protein [Artemisia annua]|uniref:non-specific serine/threonine protein kinase n=1 Tax=Artemisia annua TaxID=35608 RepID=A0A2U1MT15_ARTAN|nr:leucine-rich repeat protein [Artemisia annua]
MNHHYSHRHTSSFFLLILLLTLRFTPLLTATLPSQLVSLLALKKSLKDPLSTFHEWNTPDPGPGPEQHVWCNWSGVKCDPKTFQISSLDISNRNLSGMIPVEIKYLTSLRYLNMSHNLFTGSLPTALFDLPILQSLDINHNQFSSKFPPGISKLKYLTFFDAYSNSFTGTLPTEFIRLRYLEHLNLGGSYFEGEIPKIYGGFQNLKFLYLAGNDLHGLIPSELGRVTSLQHLEIGYQAFLGSVPTQFASLSNLTFLDISNANLSGEFPMSVTNLTMLKTLLIFKNSFRGEIPADIASLQQVEILDLSDNKFSGSIPEEISSLKNLKELSLMNNNLSGTIPEGIGELPVLEYLFLWNNSLTGSLPQKLGLNSRLQRLDVSSNNLSGQIPPNLCLGNNLTKLLMFSNRFSGELPSSLANCTSLYRFRIHNNVLNGSIPVGFGSLPNVSFMDMSKNGFTGPFPVDLANGPSLEYLNVSENSFNDVLPGNIWSSRSLQIFSASNSKLRGEIPKFKGCKNIYKIEVDGNELNGSIPWDIDHCLKLLSLNLRHNSLSGIIPWEISSIPSITEVDLSHNFLTGTIPSSFGSSRTLEGFNVSYNQLTGPVPSSGVAFSTLHPSSFTGNEGLCGRVIHKPCRAENEIEVKPRQQKKTGGTIMWIVAAALGVGVFILVAVIRCFCAKYDVAEEIGTGPWKLTAFQRLNFTADDVAESLSMTGKIIGTGGTGTVYKTEMPSGEIIAVKKLRGKHKETIRRRKGVLAEVEVLGNVRHRNIVRLLGCCSNSECTMLLYEYMPNGSLDDLLHGKNKCDNLVGDWVTRYKIALGVAQGICYLHHDCDPVVVHRDLKPSNILLDGEMEARVADFGVAKLIHCDESMSVIAGSYGYIAPEYAYTLQVDEKSDIYSYGVLLMELISGKRSVDSEFGEGNSIVDWVRSKMKRKEGTKDVLDENAGGSCSSVREEMMCALKIAMLCTSRNPADRPSMRDVVSMLLEAEPKRKSPDDVGRLVVNGAGKPQKAQKSNV